MANPFVKWSIVVAAMVGVGWYSMERGSSRNALHIPAPYLNIGEFWGQNSFEWTVPIYNHTNIEVEVESITASCHCAKVHPNRFTIPANGKTDVKLLIDAATRGTEPSNRSVSLVLYFGARLKGLPEFQWSVTGKPRNALMLSTADLVFGDSDNLFLPKHAFVTKQIVFTSAVELAELAVVGDCNDIDVQIQRASDTSGTIAVCPSGSIPYGPFERRVELQAVTKTGERLPNTAFRVQGFSQSELELSPSTLAFGFIRLGEARSREVVLKSRNNKPFVVCSLIAGGSLQLSAVAMTSDASSGAFKVFQRAASVGSNLEPVTIRAVIDGESLELKLPVSYVGIE